MSDQREQLQKKLDGVTDELRRGVEQAGDVARAIADDLGAWISGSVAPRGGSSRNPADALRELASLRADGLVTEAEFEAKKAELLRRL